VGSYAIIRRRSQKICTLLAATTLLMAVGSWSGAKANSPTQAQSQPASSDPRVIQGRITGIEGTVVTVKTPDGFPGGPGAHAQFVTAGPAFKVDVSRARILLPDGKQPDKLPLAIGDRVLIVLSGADSGSPAGRSTSNFIQTYSASILERIAAGDKIVTH
jgi:hypothetical protein